MNRFSVLIPDDFQGTSLQVVRSLGRSNRVNVEVMSEDSNASVRFSKYCLRFHLYPEANPADRIERILMLLKSRRFDVLLPTTVHGNLLINEALSSFSRLVAIPPLPKTATLNLAEDKWQTYQLARKVGCPVPQTVLLSDFQAVGMDQLKVAPPFLLKLRTSQGGIGIELFQSASQSAEFLKSLASRNLGDSAIIQKYVRGEDWGLNVLCRDGEIVAHTTQRNLIHEGNVFGTPIGLTITPNEELLKTVAGLLKELNWNGVANLDFRRVESSNSFLLVDFNPRFWGSLIASTLAGINFPLLTCLMALGKNQVETSPQNLSYAKTRCWLREKVRRSWKRRSGTPLTFRASGLAVSADDPMPDFSRVFRRMIASPQLRS